MEIKTIKTFFVKEKKIQFLKKDNQIIVYHKNNENKEVKFYLNDLLEFLKNKNKFVTTLNNVYIKKFDNFFKVDCLEIKNKTFKQLIKSI